MTIIWHKLITVVIPWESKTNKYITDIKLRIMGKAKIPTLLSAANDNEFPPIPFRKVKTA